MATTNDIPTDTLDLSSNATGFAGAVKNIIEFFRDNLGNAAFKGVSSNPPTAADDDLLEKQTFGSAAFLDVGSADDNLVLRSDITALLDTKPTGVTVSDAANPNENEIPILKDDGTGAYKIPENLLPLVVYNEVIFQTQTTLYTQGTDTAPTSEETITLLTDKSTEDYRYITFFFSVGDDNVFSECILEARTERPTATTTTKIKIDGNEIGLRKDTNGTELLFTVEDDFTADLNLDMIVGHRVST